jgi:hypothetical protein
LVPEHNDDAIIEKIEKQQDAGPIKIDVTDEEEPLENNITATNVDFNPIQQPLHQNIELVETRNEIETM